MIVMEVVAGCFAFILNGPDYKAMFNVQLIYKTSHSRIYNQPISLVFSLTESVQLCVRTTCVYFSLCWRNLLSLLSEQIL